MEARAVSHDFINRKWCALVELRHCHVRTIKVRLCRSFRYFFAINFCSSAEQLRDRGHRSAKSAPEKIASRRRIDAAEVAVTSGCLVFRAFLPENSFVMGVFTWMSRSSRFQSEEMLGTARKAGHGQKSWARPEKLDTVRRVGHGQKSWARSEEQGTARRAVPSWPRSAARSWTHRWRRRRRRRRRGRGRGESYRN